MKNKLPAISLILGVAVWLVTVTGFIYFTFFYPNKAANSTSIIPPGVLKSIFLILFNMAISSLGLFTGVCGLILAKNYKSISKIAIILNAIFLIPACILFMT